MTKRKEGSIEAFFFAIMTSSHKKFIKMHIWLVTHSEELKKANGTGKLITQLLPNMSTVVIWQRKQPSSQIIELPLDTTVLVYPEQTASNASASPIEAGVPPEHLIILDGTWQQARKMYNQSPYLQRLKHHEIKGQTSHYQRRRNQQSNGLCTAESASYLLGLYGYYHESKTLQQAFLEFNQQLP